MRAVMAPRSSRRWMSRTVVLAIVVATSITLAACGSSSSKTSSGSSSSGGSIASSSSSSSGGIQRGLKIFIVPKSAGNNYFTVADSVKTGGALAALQTLGETGQINAGSASTPASQIPEIQSAISQGAKGIILSATDATALCPTLKKAMAEKIAVVTYDSDAPACRDLFINQASAVAIADSEIKIMAGEIHDKGQIAIVSGAASATNQNVWISDMKTYLKKYPNISLVSTVYGNDDPTTASQVVSGLLQHYPKLAGIVSPDTVGVVAAAEAVDTPQYKGKIQVTGLGTPLSMKKYVLDGSVPRFELWSPANLGYLAAYAASAIASGSLKAQTGSSFTAGKLGHFTVGAENTVILGPPLVFTKANISQYDF
jgi:rhamnose transport system substrate-binding protein